MDIGIVISLLSLMVAGTVWCVRLEGRINTHDSLFGEREKQQNDRDEEIIRRLERIERKQDDANGQQHRGH